ncbi:MAG: methyltransferase [Catenulispora sp. 13_1_20CM_3_70_7]|jgi:release factor glutamine methyltransferase|nr:MAG: methyltransferase [Catenulispora sp. 13_1_20CM_3_70_7]
MDTKSSDRALSLYQRHLDTGAVPDRFSLLGQEWELLGGVFSPSFTPVTELFTTWLPYPVGGSFLEMGSGAGVTAVTAAQKGCAAVTALDISATAVANTGRNAELHGVADRVRALRSDMFDALGPDERFDLIFWNSNFVEMDTDFVNATDLHHAFFDPGYRAHRRYLAEAPGRLTDGGRLLLGFADIGNTAKLRTLGAEAGLTIDVLRAERRELEIPIEFQLLELRR